MATSSNAVQRLAPQPRRRHVVFAHSPGPNSRAPFDPPKLLCAVLIESLRHDAPRR
jgi:hypothetical protein